MVTEQQLKAIKKRGQYFHSAIDVPMAEKYHLTPDIISEIRKAAIFQKKSQQDICIKITNALESKAYETIKDPVEREKVTKLKTTILSFLLHCTPEAFMEITQLTKYDWDYQGEGKKMPSKEEYKEYLKQPDNKPTTENIIDNPARDL